MSKNKHLTESERKEIDNYLREGVSLKSIAAKLDKNPATISREVRNRAVSINKYAPYKPRNRCSFRFSCQKMQMCADRPNCTKKCSLCSFCNNICEEFEEQVCYKLYEPPYVCNGCIEESQCILRKSFYIPKKAQEAYREMLVDSRSGANITEGELAYLDELVSPLIKKGQSVHHIATHNADQLYVSEKSIYRYVSGSLLTSKNIDMPRVVRMKPRKRKPVEHKIDRSCRIGRTYNDFLKYTEESGVSIVEADSVIGRVGGKCLMTLMFRYCNLMLAFIRNHNTSQSVIDIFDWMYRKLGAERFSKLFPVILFDNGSEFSNPVKIESDKYGNQRTKAFYCDPYSSFQKPNVELNHEFIRRILPKGTSFDNLDQSDVSLMMSHINSYSREKLNDKSPFELFGFLYGFDTLDLLGQFHVPANEIVLKPILLKK